MADALDAAHMARALRLAARGLYTCDPNPRVGCVIARGETIMGQGYHAVAGEAHAEIVALGEAGTQARGATAYVTLEPCCHHGRTAPCTEALISAGVRRVVYALRDPDPRVSGRGVAALTDAGISVERMERAGAESRALNIGFIKRMATGRPWIRVKLASSLDGRTALANGESRWITGDAARTDVHRLRARSSCLLTGRGTVLADDPGLDVRLDAAALGIDRPPRQPAVAILDRQLRTPASAKLFDRHGRVTVFAERDDGEAASALRRAGADIVALAADEHGLELGAVFRSLAARSVNEVHVEAGPTLCGRLMATGHVDEVVLYMAPQLLGDTARGQFSFGPLASMEERVGLHIREIRRVGADIRIDALPIIDRE